MFATAVTAGYGWHASGRFRVHRQGRRRAADYRFLMRAGIQMDSEMIATSGSGKVPAARQDNEGGRLAYSRVGQGEPLVLLHGQGLSRRSWDPVVDLLAGSFDVIAVDLPGHGRSRRQPKGAGNAPVDQARAVAQLLDELGLDSVHVAGNSIGGWVALELARLGRARTVTALSPGGLWGRSAPLLVRISMRQARINSRLVLGLAPAAPRSRLARGLFMIQLSGHPTKVPYAAANAAIHDMATAAGFRQHIGCEASCVH